MRFTNKTVLVAGGTGGLGRAISLAFAAEGAKVVVTFRQQSEFDELRTAAGLQGPTVDGRRLDVTDESAVQDFIRDFGSAFGRMDAMVNAVGGYAGGTKLWETDSTAFNRMIALNLQSGYVLARAVAPMMLKQQSGSIVNIAAQAAVTHPAGAAAYSASKAAAVALIDCLAADLKGSGVRANSVLPSIIDTEANRKAMPHADYSHWPKPDDIARVILFLCSEDARLIHGASIPVYGG